MPKLPDLHDLVTELCKITPSAKVGDLFVDYIGESDHQGWEGFTKADKATLRKLFKDMVLYHTMTEQG